MFNDILLAHDLENKCFSATFTTDNLDKARDHLTMAPPSIRTISYDLARYLKVTKSEKTGLRIEFSCEDVDPEHSWECELDIEKQKYFASHKNTGTPLAIQIQSTSAGSTPEKLYDYRGLSIDWIGYTGLTTLIRSGGDPSQNEPKERSIASITQKIKDSGTSSGDYIEMGVCLRQLGRIDEAVDMYIKELQFAFSLDSQPFNPFTITAIQNIATAYKKKNDFGKAIVLYLIALTLNPNYFEALISACGLIDNAELSLKMAARAYKIRRNDDIAAILLQNHMGKYELDDKAVRKDFNDLLISVDVLSREPSLTVADPFETVKSLLKL